MSVGGKVRFLDNSITEKILGAQGQRKVDTWVYSNSTANIVLDNLESQNSLIVRKMSK